MVGNLAFGKSRINVLMECGEEGWKQSGVVAVFVRLLEKSTLVSSLFTSRIIYITS